MTKKFQKVELKAGTSMIEVMRRFKSAGSAVTILRAKHSRGTVDRPPFWRIDFIGDRPDLSSLVEAYL